MILSSFSLAILTCKGSVGLLRFSELSRAAGTLQKNLDQKSFSLLSLKAREAISCQLTSCPSSRRLGKGREQDVQNRPCSPNFQHVEQRSFFLPAASISTTWAAMSKVSSMPTSWPPVMQVGLVFGFRTTTWQIWRLLNTEACVPPPLCNRCITLIT